MRLVSSALAFTFALSAPVFADLTIVSKTTSGDKTGTQTQYMTSERMRVSNEGTDGIFDFASGNMTLIDHKKKQYYVMTKQDMEAMAAQMDAQMKQMEAQMASLPPAIREKMAGVMGGAAGNVNVTKGSGGRKILGYSCQNWIISMGETVKSESCVTTDLDLPMAAFEGQRSFAGGMMNMSGPMGKFMKQMADKFKEMKGIPLANTTTIKMMGKGNVTTQEVTEIKKDAIPASTFAIPEGYKKTESPAAKMIKK